MLLARKVQYLWPGHTATRATVKAATMKAALIVSPHQCYSMDELMRLDRVHPLKQAF